MITVLAMVAIVSASQRKGFPAGLHDGLFELMRLDWFNDWLVATEEDMAHTFQRADRELECMLALKDPSDPRTYEAGLAIVGNFKSHFIEEYTHRTHETQGTMSRMVEKYLDEASDHWKELYCRAQGTTNRTLIGSRLGHILFAKGQKSLQKYEIVEWNELGPKGMELTE
ncbi:hypothetical protein FRC11_007301 [Ceratobasidium sp. 423]|nr:hypothetical protein FRC11_007301 [Ceratobasidium sp. 423]